MEEIIIIILIIVLLAIYIFYENYPYYSPSNEKYCNKSETCILMAPNIPKDPQTKYQICGKYNKPIQDNNIAPTEGKFIFPKQRLLYDGIWKSDRKIDNTTEIQNWNMITDQYPIEGEYATDKFLHMPEKHMCLDMEVIDKDIYYPNWNILAMKDRNMHHLDVCDYNKSTAHKNGIFYLEAGL